MTDDREGLFLADGFDTAFIGVGRRCGQPDGAVYDITAMVALLVKRDGMTHSEALEYLEFNTIGAWVGDRTPVYVEPTTLAAWRDMDNE